MSIGKPQTTMLPSTLVATLRRKETYNVLTEFRVSFARESSWMKQEFFLRRICFSWVDGTGGTNLVWKMTGWIDAFCTNLLLRYVFFFPTRMHLLCDLIISSRPPRLLVQQLGRSGLHLASVVACTHVLVSAYNAEAEFSQGTRGNVTPSFVPRLLLRP
jgi:hypothetical protein